MRENRFHCTMEAVFILRCRRKDETMKIVILAGGGGTRLFPLSRSCYPKQFLKLGAERSLFGQTVERFLRVAAPEDIVVVTQEAYFFHVRAELRESGADAAHVLLEPVGRNTAPIVKSIPKPGLFVNAFRYIGQKDSSDRQSRSEPFAGSVQAVTAPSL